MTNSSLCVRFASQSFQRNHRRKRWRGSPGLFIRHWSFQRQGTTPTPRRCTARFKNATKDGLDVLQEIRAHERTRFLPVVLLTSSKEEQDIIEGYRHGVNSYVRKPVDFDEFLKAVQNLGLYWLILNEVPPA